jgi:hypothetical protein
MMNARKVRYVIEPGTPFSLHAEGLSISAITRKSEIPVIVEIEGMTRRVLLAFQDAIEKELARREESWKRESENLHREATDRPAEILKPVA